MDKPLEKIEKKEDGKKQPDEEGLMHALKAPAGPLFTRRLAIILTVALILGVGSGFVASQIRPKAQKAGTVALDGSTSGGTIKKGQVYGSDNTSVFRDTAEGVLKEGGMDGEGSHHLVRPGGDSQNVYLTSSIVDLSLFIDRKIKIWGETFKGQKAGWLMDVGRVEVLQ
ncbi:MAG: hypothetical protein HYT11_00950 [Candidatus Levybacteria bacterium]|nr:hypothetical protein [Candidatus Levybacteria bacterium]